jgi:uncharacterized protein (TIGR02271 family)
VREPESKRDTDKVGALPDRAPTEQETLKLLAEELAVELRQVETGRVRVNVVTLEHQELVDIPLAREQIVLDRVPIDRRIDEIPAIREDGDTIIVPVVEEILIVERHLMLKEEIHLKRIHTTEQYRENVTLRRQEAVVTRSPIDIPDVAPHPAVDTKSRIK